MQRLEYYIKHFKHIVLMWFILFSLSPCIVKETLLQNVSSAYSKPLNQSRAITFASSCIYAENEKTQSSVGKKVAINRYNYSINFLEYLYSGKQSLTAYNHYSGKFTGNSPPKYILYKRLKIAIV